jgi:hypothetical protein
MAKRVYLFDGLSAHNQLATNYNGFWDCQESPLESGVYLTPIASTEVEPPEFDGKISTCTWDGAQWVLTEIPKAVVQVPQVTVSDQPKTTGTTEL